MDYPIRSCCYAANKAVYENNPLLHDEQCPNRCGPDCPRTTTHDGPCSKENH